MPSAEVVQKAQQKLHLPVHKTEISAGVLFLPKEPTIRLSDPNHATGIPTLFSSDAEFRRELKAMVADIREQWEPNDLRSIILGAPSGTGKTTILTELQGDWGKSLGVYFELLDPAKIDWIHLESYLDNIKKASASDRVLLGIDEAQKHPAKRKIDKYGVTLLNAAHAREIRFLLVDATFKDGESPKDSEFSSRCKSFYLPGLNKRLGDIPYIVGGMLYKLIGTTPIFVDRSFLIALTNKSVQHPNLRKIKEYVKTSVDAGKREFAAGAKMVLSARHLPREVGNLSKNDSGQPDRQFEYLAGR